MTKPRQEDERAEALQTSHEMGWALEQIIDKFDQDPPGAKESLVELLAAHRDFDGVLQRLLAP